VCARVHMYMHSEQDLQQFPQKKNKIMNKYHDIGWQFGVLLLCSYTPVYVRTSVGKYSWM
jgi:hypothetical protein